MPGRIFFKLLALPSLLVALNTCTLDIDIPEYSLEFEGQLVYDPVTADVQITYTFVAEEAFHPCRISLREADGTVVEAEYTEILPAGVPHTFQRNLSGSDDGVYEFRVVVQAEQNGEIVDMPFLDKTFEFYLDGNVPAAPIVTLPEDTYVGDQVTLFEHEEWNVPAGSPVEVYYTLNGDDPDPRNSIGQRYDGSAVLVPASSTPVVVKAVACDMVVDHVQQPPVQSTISFMDAQEVTPVSASITEEFVPGFPGVHTIVISGYGFNASTTVVLYDVDGTEVSSSIVPPIHADQIMVTVNLNHGTGGTEPGVDTVDTGSGTLVIKNSGLSSSPTDCLDFQIVY